MTYKVKGILSMAYENMQTYENLIQNNKKTLSLIEKALNGDDIVNDRSPLPKKIIKMRGMLEVVKMRLTRYVDEGKDDYLRGIYNDLETFLQPESEINRESNLDGEDSPEPF
jgi:hypothetical protein